MVNEPAYQTHGAIQYPKARLEPGYRASLKAGLRELCTGLPEHTDALLRALKDLPGGRRVIP